jgi:hypothetical protein
MRGVATPIMGAWCGRGLVAIHQHDEAVLAGTRKPASTFNRTLYGSGKGWIVNPSGTSRAPSS